MVPNSIAFLALLAWPVITFLIFRALPREKAFIWSLLLGYLLLPPPPAQFDAPLLPILNKENIPSLAVLLVMFAQRKFSGSFIPKSNIAKALVLIYILGPSATVMGNSDEIHFGQHSFPGLRLFDMLSLIVQQCLLIAPFLIARNMLTTREGQRDLMLAFVYSGLFYSIFMLIEVRLSPQLNTWIYGFLQHNFDQLMREGGFRPIVFLYHGLWVALFAMMSVIAVASIYRSEPVKKTRRFYAGVIGYLYIVLFLCKSLGALIYATVLLPVVLFLGRHLQIKIAVLVAILAISYPFMKMTDTFPRDWVMKQALSFSAERAQSLEFRLDNEDILLKRAQQRPIFGWGSWGRNQVLHPISGRYLTTVDGRWVIVFGVFGAIGFLAEFGLIAFPIFLLWRVAKHVPENDIPFYIPAIALLVAFNLVDMIPNATLTPLTWMLSGALLGYAEFLYEKYLIKASFRPFRGRLIINRFREENR